MKKQLISSKRKIQKGVHKVTVETKRNITWLKNQALLQETYVRLISKLKCCPTVKQISEETNLSIKTIKLHIKDLKFQPSANPLRVLTGNVLAAIYTSACEGSAQSQRLWVSLLEGWSEKAELTHKFDLKNINLEKLTDSQLAQLEGIVKSGEDPKPLLFSWGILC
ncbi:MAG: hypothetical protein C4539_08945 [Ignavibacteriales bacterium]|nr:MAG: hypothetical protein C4539_08945 [Ignavibacteriales bacterium]